MPTEQVEAWSGGAASSETTTSCCFCCWWWFCCCCDPYYYCANVVVVAVVEAKAAVVAVRMWWMNKLEQEAAAVMLLTLILLIQSLSSLELLSWQQGSSFVNDRVRSEMRLQVHIISLYALSLSLSRVCTRVCLDHNQREVLLSAWKLFTF
jgi:hypothetical protein